MDTAGVKVLETAEDIQDRRQQVLDRYRRFKELSIMRRQKLEDSYRFQCFRRDAEELEKWIQEKLQIASDENYKDPSNLQVLGLNTAAGFVPACLGYTLRHIIGFGLSHRASCRNIRPLKRRSRPTPVPLSSWMKLET